MHLFTKYIACIMLFMRSLWASGQAPASVSSLIQPFDAYRRQTAQEKLFVHTDQSFYLTGETVWFKIYYVDGTFHKPIDLSKVAYLDVLDKDGKSVLQTKVAITSAGG